MFDELVKHILRAEKAAGSIDVNLVGDRRIRQLNKTFRKKDKPTDVLAFPYKEPIGPGKLLGDVIISRETTRRNAKRFKVSYQAELKRLVIHGVLHVLGYDHGKRMNYAEKIYSQL